MRIRELTAEDRETATGLWQEAGLTRPWIDPTSDFNRALNGPTSAVLGALDADGLAATVVVGHDGHRGWVYYPAVTSGRRRSGLGRRMMREAEAWLRRHVAVKLNVMIRQCNADVLGFYRQLGYEDDDVIVVARWLVEPA